MAGFEKAREWLRAGRAGLVVQAADGSADERVRFLSGARGTVAVHAPLPAAALGGVFGRDRAVHVVVLPGTLADRIGLECTRLAGIAPEAGRERQGSTRRIFASVVVRVRMSESNDQDTSKGRLSLARRAIGGWPDG